MPRRMIDLFFPFLLLSGSSVFAQFQAPDAGGPVLDEKQVTQRYQVGVVIEAQGGPCRGLYGTIPMPAAWPEQDVQIAQEDKTPLVSKYRFRNLDGVQQLQFWVNFLPAGQTASTMVTLNVTRRAILAPAEPEKLFIPRNVPRDIGIHLGASSLIEVRDGSIRDKVKEIVDTSQPAWQQVESIYDWVRENIEYRDGRQRGAAATLKEGVGSKHDLTGLFIALCRAHKVPARTVWITDHCYAEFYLQDEEREGQWFPCQVAGTRDFGTMSDYRPILQKGDNIKTPERRDAQRFVNEYLTGQGGRGAGTPQVEFIRKLLPSE